jgi:hypothetical protein
MWGLKRNIAASIDFDPLTMTIVCDPHLKIRNAFEKWHGQIFNKEYWLVNYLETYCSDIQIDILSKKNTLVKRYMFEKAYPQTIGSLKLGYGEKESYLEFTVNFRYLTMNSETKTNVL